MVHCVDVFLYFNSRCIITKCYHSFISLNAFHNQFSQNHLFLFYCSPFVKVNFELIFFFRKKVGRNWNNSSSLLKILCIDLIATRFIMISWLNDIQHVLSTNILKTEITLRCFCLFANTQFWAWADKAMYFQFEFIVVYNQPLHSVVCFHSHNTQNRMIIAGL